MDDTPAPRRRGGAPADREAGGARWPAANAARDADGGSYLQTLLVSAVAAVLVTRFFLEATGFPRVGRGELYVAHVLWGGLLMLVALFLVFRAVERSVLVAVLVTQVVLFWHDQLAALGGLAWNLVLLSALRYMIRQEAGRAAIALVGEDSEPRARIAPG